MEDLAGYDDGAFTEINDISFKCDGNFPIQLGDGDVIFRRCLFSNPGYGIQCKHSRGTEYVIDYITVTFENCHFEEFKTFAVKVGFAYNAVFLHCTFSNNKIDILCQGGKLKLVNCVFRNSSAGIYCQHGASIHISHSLFDTSRLGSICILNCKDVVIEKSRMENGMKYAIKIEDKSVVKIASCSIMNCLYGVHFDVGKVKAVVENSIFSDIREHYCIFISPFVIGNITLNNNTMLTNEDSDIRNESDDTACTVIVNGNVFLKNIFNSTAELEEMESKMLLQTKDTGGKLLSLRRTIKTIGHIEHAPQCNKCQLKEPKDKKFSKCGRCERVVYCSKDCQTADWAEHKAICKPIERWNPWDALNR
jgi:hypothetical protein